MILFNNYMTIPKMFKTLEKSFLLDEELKNSIKRYIGSVYLVEQKWVILISILFPKYGFYWICVSSIFLWLS